MLLKAAAGGGGKGMRVVREANELEMAFRMAQSEAKGAFGDDRVYLEKYLDGPRHIEMQILADQYGHVVYLGERECSIQRRHQKVIEESPSTAVDETLRQELGAASVALAKASHYSGAGTMEFLLDSQGNFYFLEMNTRLQVEHPVTEEVTGIDIVKQQIKVAEGETLPFQQEDVKRNGHSIECRICAEDPADNFMPSTGILTRFRLPEGRIRVENGFREGDEISVFYDSLMAKVISWGQTRTDAINSMKRALSEFSIEGVKSTIPFCGVVIRTEEFVEGKIDTRFVEKHFRPASMIQDLKDERIAAAVAAVLISEQPKTTEANSVDVSGKPNPWKDSRSGSHR